MIRRLSARLGARPGVRPGVRLAGVRVRLGVRFGGRDAGVMTLSLAIVLPAVIAVIMLVVQAALWWYASQAALTAAREGVEAGRIRDATAADGPDRARDFLGRVGELAKEKAIEPSGDADTYRLSVSVHPLLVLPGFEGLSITETASAPRERFVPQGAR
ncbi:TadE family protein [Kitasatospora cinereorecta]|uniref:TadE family protein n=2 Tax=Kitasatospora TaxID=2063 RepID=A0ABW0VP55_9ACTN